MQAGIYRQMKAVTGGRWEEHQPATNALWLHYLADVLLSQKGVPLSSAQKRRLRDFRCTRSSWPHARLAALGYSSCSRTLQVFASCFIVSRMSDHHLPY